MVVLKKHNLVFIALAIFGIVLLLLSGLVTHWGFLHDDYGVLWHAKHVQSWESFCKLFYEPCMYTGVQPSNHIIPTQSFFAIIYRPLSFFFYAIQIHCLGLAPYKLYLTTIALHACNAALLFFLYTRFLPVPTALLGAIFFAFHLSLWDWIGWIAGQQQVFTLTLLLSISLLIMYYLQAKKNWLLATTLSILCLLHLAALFIREEAIVMPLWLTLIYFFYKKILPHSDRLKYVIYSFLLTNLFYIGIRAHFYPIENSRNGFQTIFNSILNFVFCLQNRFFDAVTFIVDITHLSWMPGGNRLLKGIAICFMITLFCLVLYRSISKKNLIFCILSMCLWMWPVIIRHYSSRYLYCALPFFCFAVVLAFTYGHKNRFFFYFKRIFILLLAIFSIATLPAHLKERGHTLYTYNQALIDLAKNPVTHKNPICFIAIPYEVFTTGCAQALWMYGVPTKTPIYYDRRTFTWTKHPLKPLTQNLIDIQILEDGFRITSQNKDLIWFLPMDISTLLGKIIPHKKNHDKVVDLSIILDQQWLDQKPIFITWDYEKNLFKTIKDPNNA